MSRSETVFAVLAAVIVTIAGGGVFYFVSTMAVHPDPAAVPSTPGVHAERHSRAIEESRRLARGLLLQDNLPGLSVAVARDGKLLFAGVSVARMTMRHLSGSGIEAYLDQAGEAVTTSVGAYQLEGLGVHLFERIEGDHFTILGLPLLPLLAFLREQGLLGV